MVEGSHISSEGEDAHAFHQVRMKADYEKMVLTNPSKKAILRMEFEDGSYQDIECGSPTYEMDVAMANVKAKSLADEKFLTFALESEDKINREGNRIRLIIVAVAVLAIVLLWLGSSG